MKKFIILLSLILSLFSCTKKPTTTTATFLIIDQTDSNQMVQKITKEDITKLTHPIDPFSGKTTYLSFVTGMRHSPVHQWELPPVDDINNYNQFTRKAEIDSFQRKTGTAIIQRIQSQATGSASSLVFYTLAKAIGKCQNTDFERANIYLLSDLMNKDQRFNAYDSDHYALVKFDLDSTYRLLNSYFQPEQIARTSHIRVHLLYQPTTTEADRHFDRMARFLKGYLEQKGIQVHIGSVFP